MNNRLKTILTILMGCLSFGALAALASGPPISISIKAAQRSVKRGDSVAVTVKNVSDQTIPEFLRAFSGYVVLVVDENGKPVKESEKGKNPVRAERTVYVALKPQEQFEEDLPISGEVDMTAPGKYFVRFVRRIPKDQGGGVAASNVVSITVEDSPK
jgi:hypothetical protein